MTRIIKIGMDVHKDSFTLCAMEPKFGGKDTVFSTIKTGPHADLVVDYIDHIREKMQDDDLDIECGYEAGCLGYVLYAELKARGVKCTILAPTTMMAPQGKRVKTDARDALMIAQCLSYGGYKAVHIPTDQDAAVSGFLRMRDDHKAALKKIKQQILSFALRNGLRCEANNWTQVHLQFLRYQKCDPVVRETLNEYLQTYDYLNNRIDAMNKRIHEFCQEKAYCENVKKLQCLIGIKEHTALALITEVGDFTRFDKGNTLGAYLGLTPGEQSSGAKIVRTRISKAGNGHLRKLLTESAQGICKGQIGYKSKDLKSRQEGNSKEVIAYADRANEYMRRKYYRLIRKGKKHNIAVTAIARDLSCFVWGLMTDNIYIARN
ncbi:IS110 family transposase [Faecalibaculum rodentium]|uniref:IS110 family transposase n=1 Tax=Faecalibaculum rodentium TaxID=1702221 RepID=UPI0025B789B7|nr:IS110 family transposase [Faecalibaculum rodentium]